MQWRDADVLTWHDDPRAFAVWRRRDLDIETMGKTKRRAAQVNELVRSGISQAEVARLFGISRQRVSQIMSEPEKPEERAHRGSCARCGIRFRDTGRGGKRKFCETCRP